VYAPLIHTSFSAYLPYDHSKDPRVDELSEETAPADGDCCDPVGESIGGCFDRLMVRRTASGRLPPLNPISERLFALIAPAADSHPSVLEIGCGGGAMLVALLGAGAKSADGFDLSVESIRIARRRAADAGVDDRVTLRVGDGAGAMLPRHDWVVLDRVLCCYPRLDALLANAIGAATNRIAFSVPVSYGWRGWVARAVVGLENALAPLRSRECRAFVHDVSRIEGALSAAGFRSTASSRRRFWHMEVFERPVAAAS
jgi:SAM-dependent methyltransferase